MLNREKNMFCCFRIICWGFVSFGFVSDHKNAVFMCQYPTAKQYKRDVKNIQQNKQIEKRLIERVIDLSSESKWNDRINKSRTLMFVVRHWVFLFERPFLLSSLAKNFTMIIPKIMSLFIQNIKFCLLMRSCRWYLNGQIIGWEMLIPNLYRSILIFLSYFDFYECASYALRTL